MLFEGKTAKGVLSPERFSELLRAEKIEFPTVTSEEIEDRSKSDGFSKTIALGQTLWFVAQFRVLFIELGLYKTGAPKRKESVRNLFVRVLPVGI